MKQRGFQCPHVFRRADWHRRISVYIRPEREWLVGGDAIEYLRHKPN